LSWAVENGIAPVGESAKSASEILARGLHKSMR
jgi:hypothetical protein